MRAKLSLGPALFNWGAAYIRDFYFRIAEEAPVDTVYLGEVVCVKRLASPQSPDLEVVAQRLEAAGKEVILSTPALVMGEPELEVVREAAAGARLVEANDVSCVGLLAGRPHAIGPFVNVYNEGTLAFLTGLGAVRVALPAELSAAALAALARTAEVELEVQVFGRLPLAVSSRCFHARARGLRKDNCRFVCAEDAEGFVVESLDGESLFVVNGTQTLSYTFANLLGGLTSLQASGIKRFRLWPHAVDMAAVVTVFREVLDGRLEEGAGVARLRELVGGVPFADGFFHGKEGRRFLACDTGGRPAP
ncbi:MAG: U32 family peptidase [Alphaproteobacteria bacterium]